MSTIAWKTQQTKSALHWGAVSLYGTIIFLSYHNRWFLAFGFIIFLLATSLHMVWKMLIFMALVGIVLAVFPFLAPFAIILMIVLFIMRINYVKENWRPILIGLLVYGSIFPLFFMTQMYYGGIESLVVAVIGAALLHFSLNWLYTYGYSTKTALGIMGSVPLVILAFILPFLKMHIPAPDVFVEPAADPVIFHPQDAKVLPSTEHVAVHNSSEPLITRPLVTSQIESHPQIINHYVETPQSNPVIPFDIQPQSSNEIGTLKLHPNIFGGYDVVGADGMKTISTHSNIFNGQDVYDPSGHKLASSQPNVFEGNNVYDPNNQMLFKTQENVFGGHDILNPDNTKVGYTSPRADGVLELYNQHGQKIGTIENDMLHMEFKNG
ncbi:hypothetical protein ACFFF5_14295 [Lederbergia wuyishanensis]|uniref:Uncharacterized protein n=1 Tax=Lederbergia wuyishanensis TaxID=1347903 RepID=A0ABU0D9K0_9BACI|nr:hypothetical protein [Lederbergia wuyishanensis]MCJ8007464.1 hypothetical protein [Lederbergia wuyishanensis]MDQ0345097.1 hypothetical protein [Lederbergia wuyishanensis]